MSLENPDLQGLQPTFQALGQRLRELSTPPPPTGLRIRLEGRLRRERRLILARVGVVAACILLLSGLGFWLRESDEAGLFVQDHRHMVTSGLADIRTQDRLRLENFFAGNLDFAPQLPDWAWAQPTSGRLCKIRSQLMARIQYRYGPYELSLFVRPARPGLAPGLQEHRLQGYQLLSWTRSGLEYLLVGPDEAAGLRHELESNWPRTGRPGGESVGKQNPTRAR